MKQKTSWNLMVMFALLAGCGGSPVPAEQLGRSEAAVRAAQEANATSDPKASLHLKLAQEQLDHARALIKDNDNKRADMILQRAEADAELARALAKESAIKSEAQQALDQAQQLRQGNSTK